MFNPCHFLLIAPVDSEGKLSTGVIVAICFGGAAAVAIIALLLWKFRGKTKGLNNIFSSGSLLA